MPHVYGVRAFRKVKQAPRKVDRKAYQKTLADALTKKVDPKPEKKG